MKRNFFVMEALTLVNNFWFWFRVCYV